MYKGIIYKATNKKTNMVYIGATKKSVEERQKDHIQKSANNSGGFFQNEISTYGAENFDWEQIDTAESANELAEKERQYILQYKYRDESYNTDAGGGIIKRVYQYHIQSGELLNSFWGLKEASKSVRVDKKSISKACLGEIKTCAGYYWSYGLSANFKPEEDRRKQQVFQFSMEGEFLVRYKSVAEASRKTNVNKTSIAKCCRKEYKSAGDYYWEYKSIERNNEEEYNNKIFNYEY